MTEKFSGFTVWFLAGVLGVLGVLVAPMQAAVDYNQMTIFTASDGAEINRFSKGDLNRDGSDDIAVGLGNGNFGGDGRVFRLTQTGTRGVFAGGGSYLDVWNHPVVVKVGEVTGDGYNDILVGRTPEVDDLWRLRSDGADSFVSELTDNWGFPYAGPEIADLNQDGLPDYTLIRSSASELYVEFQDGAGNYIFTHPSNFGGDQHNIATGHLDATTAQNVNDIVLSRWFSSSSYSDVRIQFQTGVGIFTDKIISGYTPTRITQLAVGDLDADGDQDILVVLVDGRLFKEEQTASQSFSSSNILNYGLPLTAVAVGDVNSDGRDDIVVGRSDGNLYVELQQSDGSFSAAPGPGIPTATLDPNIVSIAIGDLDNDGLNDFAVGLTNGTVMVFYQEQGACVAPVSGDLNDDCKVDTDDLGLLAGKWLDSTMPGPNGIVVETNPSGTIVNGDSVVDGDLSDWGNQLEWIAIDKPFGSTPNDITTAQFAARWDASNSKIYIAVEVNDTDHVFTSSYTAWNDHDGIELFTQGDAAGGEYGMGADPVSFENAQQYMIGYDGSGGSWAVFGNGDAPDPSLEYAVVVSGDTIRYEIAVKQYDSYPSTVTTLNVNDIVGLDVVVSSKSALNFGQMAANTVYPKSQNADSFEHYTLVDELPCGTWGYLPEDLNTDCRVDLADFTEIASHWLECNLFVQGDCWN